VKKEGKKKSIEENPQKRKKEILTIPHLFFFFFTLPQSFSFLVQILYTEVLFHVMEGYEVFPIEKKKIIFIIINYYPYFPVELSSRSLLLSFFFLLIVRCPGPTEVFFFFLLTKNTKKKRHLFVRSEEKKIRVDVRRNGSDNHQMSMMMVWAPEVKREVSRRRRASS
jgi:hypothetical protein